MNARFIFLALLAAGLLTASSPAASGNAEKTRQLIAVLQSNAGFYEKARACQQLGEIGTKEAVPALAALLPDEHLSAYARSGLEGTPDPSAAEALRAAVPALKGSRLAGVINSLGVLRDAKSVGTLSNLANDPSSGVAKEALLALGRISNAESIGVIREVLAKGPEASRPDAAAACLLAAERQLKDGNARTAAAIYDEARKAQAPLVYRAGATRGAILARESEAPAFLVAQLRAEERVIRNVALLTIREIPSDKLAGALNAELENANPELQVLLLNALLDCHNPKSLQVLQAKAASDNAGIRKTALVVLGKIGGPAEAGVLLKAVAENRNAEESSLALKSLGRIKGDAVDQQVVAALASAKNSVERVNLLGLLESRGAANAAAAVLNQAADPDGKVSLAALTALKSLAGPRELPGLIALTKTFNDEARREAAENAVYTACSKMANAEAAVDTVLAELKQAAEPADKSSWIRVLALLGNAKGLGALKAALADPNEAVALSAVENLGQWPDPSPIEDLLAVVEANPEARAGKRALAATIHLATTATDEHQRPEPTVIKWLERAGKAARTPEEKRMIISVLGRLKHSDSFRLLQPHLDNPSVRAEASLAILQIAPALVKSADAATLKATLEKISSTTSNPDLRTRADKLAKTISEGSQK